MRVLQDLLMARRDNASVLLPEPRHKVLAIDLWLRALMLKKAYQCDQGEPSSTLPECERICQSMKDRDVEHSE